MFAGSASTLSTTMIGLEFREALSSVEESPLRKSGNPIQVWLPIIWKKVLPVLGGPFTSRELLSIVEKKCLISRGIHVLSVNVTFLPPF